MKLIDDLKKQVEKAESKDEKKRLIENAGMALTDDELDMVAGGVSSVYKAVNSALTELDEDGVDIGGSYVLYQ